MRTILNFFLLTAGIAGFLAACDKAETLPLHGSGTASVLSASSTNVAPAPIDSNKIALTLNWTSPQYDTDTTNYKFVIEIDSTGKNFAKADTRTVTGKLTTSFIAKELNTLLLDRGYAFNVPVDMDVRLKASYGNNNELKLSNVVKIKMTPYKVPPKVALPASLKLFIVGSGTAGGDATGWNNPVPVPSQEFSRIDETTWGGIFQLTGGKSYLLLPTNDNVWDIKYGGTGGNNSNNVDGDNFKVGGSDLKTPAASGMYKIIFDFQQGKFTVTPYTGTLASSLFIVGNATPGGDATGWNNPVPVPSQQFTRVNSSLFELTIPLIANKSYLLLPANGSWDHKYGGLGGNNSNNVLGDELKYDGSDLKAPTENATYKISINFASGTAAGSSAKFSVVKQ
ncbi:MAG TPA: SusE domain-containing protein [Chitinophagaceae bacterium]|nr:SusE domain-containing protein [Chitinophagaceae bacterium]